MSFPPIRDWAASLGIVITALTVIADGAKWIWNQSRKQFPGAGGVLDIFHVLEYIADATRTVYGEKSGSARGWKVCGLHALLRDGWPGLCDWIGRWRERCDPEHSEQVEKATEPLLTYLANHTDYLGYRQRLEKGTTIGSGQIEGACKYVIGRRLKRSGGRWRQANSVKMGALCSTHYSGDWTDYWQASLGSPN